MSLGLDVTGHGGKGYLSVVLYSPRDAAKLGRAGFLSVTEVADLDAQSRRDRRTEADWARRTSATTDTSTFQNTTPIAILDGGLVAPGTPYPLQRASAPRTPLYRPAGRPFVCSTI